MNTPPFQLMTILAVSFVMALTAIATTIHPVQAQSIMQCMEKCIREEGNSSSQKKICKSKCASVPGVFQNGGQKKPERSCMAQFKNCQKSCPPGDKNCKKTCKGRLMSCV